MPLIATIIATLTAILTASVIEIGGVMVKSDDLVADARVVVSQGNRWQLSTALELYYLDHNRYPLDQNAESMIHTLSDEGYIRNEPIDTSVFEYYPVQNAQEYVLKIH